MCQYGNEGENITPTNREVFFWVSYSIACTFVLPINLSLYAFKMEKRQNEGRRRLCSDKAITVNVKEWLENGGF